MERNGTRPIAEKSELVPTRASLLARLKNLGDDQSWRVFFDTYHRLIYGRVINAGLPPHEAEDVVMEIVEGVARRLPAFEYDPRRCSFKTWLFRIVRNRLVDHFRRRARELPRAVSETDGAGMLTEIADPDTLEPDKQWNEDWEHNLFQAALDRVRQRANPRYLQIFIYSELEEHSVAETARHLQTTANDVSVAKHRIKDLLHQEVGKIRREEEERDKQAL